MQITKESLRRKNFIPDEFFVSEKAKKLGVVNYPDKGQELSILTAMMSTADMMQQLRELLGKPIKITSTYRCKKVNDAVGSKDSSQHLLGLACDFVCPSFGTPEEIVKFLCDKDFLVDQCFNEGSWVHISRLLPKMSLNRNPNRMIYGYYLYDEKLKKRVLKSI